MRFPIKLVAVLSVSAVMACVACTSADEEARDGKKAGGEPAASSNRPMRHRQNLVLTVGQTEGDLQGKDDKTIQAGIEYLGRLGGGTLRILPGVYNLRNAIYLRPNVVVQGSGEGTVLKKTDGVVTPLLRDSDWFEYGVQVKDANGFTPGAGIMLRSKTGPGDWQCKVLRHGHGDPGKHPLSGSADSRGLLDRERRYSRDYLPDPYGGERR